MKHNKNDLLKNGMPCGTWGDKYQSHNPIICFFVYKFKNSISYLLRDIGTQIHSFTELGCGEGEITRFIHILLNRVKTKASDFSEEIIEIAKKNNKDLEIIFYQKSIYDIDQHDKADLIVCCEVLEHLHDPFLALARMKALNAKYYLFSVPNEPIFRLINFFRGKYFDDFGNSPGHINHWSSSQFYKLIEHSGYEIIHIHNPFPWTMLLARSRLK
jgi:SAM-dependent methyltransferase